MKNYIKEGKTLLITVPSGGLLSGQPFVQGSKVVICVTDGDEGDEIAANTYGVYSVAKANEAIAQGDRLYYDETNEVFTKVVGGVFAGYAASAALQADTELELMLIPSVSPTVAADNIADEATADGSDLATTQALANALKDKVNALLAALKEVGLMVADA